MTMTEISIAQKVIDKFERPLISLRISITNRCNVKCFYCHHDGIVPQNYEMTPNEMERIVKVAKDIGIEKIRLSGGEPLIREDIVDIVAKISSVGFRDISLTTNGILLGKYACLLYTSDAADEEDSVDLGGR